MSEGKRGCGHRKIGGLYLVCDPGFELVCDGLPLELEPCGCCGFKPPFSRNLQRIQPAYIIQAEYKKHDRDPGAIEDRHECSCPPNCPICNAQKDSVYRLMFVGKNQYTPSSFIKEAFNMGVSKRIPEIPAWLKLGETWILLAHHEVPKVSLEQMKSNRLQEKEPEYMSAVFYAFKPSRVEMPVWKGSLTDQQILTLEEHGITPIFLDPTPKNKKLHGIARDEKRNLEKYLKPIPCKIQNHVCDHQYLEPLGKELLCRSEAHRKNCPFKEEGA